MQEDTGYLTATVGALVGALVVGLLGLCVGWLWAYYYVSTYDYSQGGDPFGLPYIVLGVSLGIIVGEVVGCWQALSAWDYSAAFVTALLLAVLLVASIGGLVMAAINSDDLGILRIIPVCFFTMPAVARGLVNALVPDAE